MYLLSRVWNNIYNRRGHNKIQCKYKNLFMIGFYIIHMLCSLQLPTTTLKCLLMSTLKQSLPLSCYCVCISEKSAAEW